MHLLFPAYPNINHQKLCCRYKSGGHTISTPPPWILAYHLHTGLILLSFNHLAFYSSLSLPEIPIQ
jgi:hypothetical protein